MRYSACVTQHGRVDTHDDDEQSEVEQQPYCLQHFHDPMAGAPVQVVDVKGDAIDLQAVPLDLALAVETFTVKSTPGSQQSSDLWTSSPWRPGT